MGWDVEMTAFIDKVVSKEEFQSTNMNKNVFTVWKTALFWCKNYHVNDNADLLIVQTGDSKGIRYSSECNLWGHWWHMHSLALFLSKLLQY